MKLFNKLVGIQYGDEPDEFGWMTFAGVAIPGHIHLCLLQHCYEKVSGYLKDNGCLCAIFDTNSDGDKDRGRYIQVQIGQFISNTCCQCFACAFSSGNLGMVLINARQLSDYFRESLSFTIMLKEDAREADIRMLQKELDAKPYVKQTEYVSKDEAAVKLKMIWARTFLIFWGIIR